ncbi:MAG: hypothetical protein IKM61_04390 [Eubacteriaceae bacterium]|nr:hypothetical protein [Eubacteriaceae bacterium]
MKKDLSKNKIRLIIFSVALCALLIFNYVFSYSLFSMSDVQFQNLDNQMLSAAYSQSSNTKGVIIASDLSHDKGELSNLVHELTKLGYGVYVFDYPSNGLSGGNIPFGIRESDYLAEQFYCALVSFSQLSGLSEKDIHLVGYGMGARGILHCAALGLIHPASISLVGTDLNLSDSLQYDILNFTVDSELSWVNELTSTTPGCDIHIVYSPVDEVSSAEDNELLKNKLTGGISSVARLNDVTTSSVFAIHSLLMYSPSVAGKVASYIADLDGMEYSRQFLLAIRPVSIVIMLGLYMLLLICVARAFPARRFGYTKIKMPENFFRDKILMVFASVVVMAALAFGLYLVPIRYPYNDIVSLVLMCGYGVTMYVLYRYSSFAGGMGKYMFTGDRTGKYRFSLLAMVAISIGVGIISVCGFYNPLSIFIKWDWCIIFSVLCSFTFYIDQMERQVLRLDAKQKKILVLINYLPIIIGFAVMLLLGVLSSAYKMVVMMLVILLCLSTEGIMRKVGCSTRMTALYKGFLFSMVIFSQASMFFYV